MLNFKICQSSSPASLILRRGTFILTFCTIVFFVCPSILANKLPTTLGMTKASFVANRSMALETPRLCFSTIFDNIVPEKFLKTQFSLIIKNVVGSQKESSVVQGIASPLQSRIFRVPRFKSVKTRKVPVRGVRYIPHGHSQNGEEQQHDTQPWDILPLILIIIGGVYLSMKPVFTIIVCILLVVLWSVLAILGVSEWTIGMIIGSILCLIFVWHVARWIHAKFSDKSQSEADSKDDINYSEWFKNSV